MADEIKITALDQHALETAVTLLRRFFEEEGFATPAGEIRSNLTAMVGDDSCWAGLASIDGEPVGVVTVTTMLYAEWGRMGEVGDLYVIPRQRGHGVARALVDTALEWCRQRNCSAVSVVVTPEGDARHKLSALYESLNFRNTGRTIMTRLL